MSAGDLVEVEPGGAWIDPRDVVGVTSLLGEGVMVIIQGGALIPVSKTATIAAVVAALQGRPPEAATRPGLSVVEPPR